MTKPKLVRRPVAALAAALLVLMAVLAFLMIGPASSEAKIAFASDQVSPHSTKHLNATADGIGSNIWTMNDDGSQQRRVTSVVTADGPSWSPNGKFIVYTRVVADRESEKHAGSLEVRVIGEDGKGDRLLWRTYDATDSSRAAWSPDGSAIAFYDGARKKTLIIEPSSGRLRFEAEIFNFGFGRPDVPLWLPGGHVLIGTTGFAETFDAESGLHTVGPKLELHPLGITTVSPSGRFLFGAEKSNDDRMFVTERYPLSGGGVFMAPTVFKYDQSILTFAGDAASDSMLVVPVARTTQCGNSCDPIGANLYWLNVDTGSRQQLTTSSAALKSTESDDHFDPDNYTTNTDPDWISGTVAPPEAPRLSAFKLVKTKKNDLFTPTKKRTKKVAFYRSNRRCSASGATAMVTAKLSGIADLSISVYRGSRGLAVKRFKNLLTSPAIPLGDIVGKRPKAGRYRFVARAVGPSGLRSAKRSVRFRMKVVNSYCAG